MMDIKLAFGDREADLASMGYDLATDDSLQTAIVISLFTDRLADFDDELPAGETDSRGWWADELQPDSSAGEPNRIGSKLWMLQREKQTEGVRVRAEQHCREALQWMLDDGLVRTVEIHAEWSSRGFLAILVRVDGGEYNFKYPWEA